jgi:hypothetical protein
LIMVYDLFNVLLNLVWRYFGDFYICVNQVNWSIVLFLVVSISGLVSGTTGIVEWVWSHSFPFYYME